MDTRTWEAAEKILKEGLANLIILGSPEEVEKYGKGYDVTGATIIDPATYEKTEEYLDLFVELRKKKGLTKEEARKQALSDYAAWLCLDDLQTWTKCVSCRMACTRYHTISITSLDH